MAKYYIYESELYHHGILGQKWGVRRYQNKDGSLTSLGKKHADQNGEHNNNDSNNKVSSEKKIDEKEKSKYSKEQLERANKVLLAIGAGALAGAAGYAYVKWKNENEDMVISAGQTMKRMTTNSEPNLHDQFYASTNERDAVKYLGIFGGVQKGGSSGQTDIYQYEMSPKTDIKVAGTKTAKKLFEEMTASGELVEGFKDYDTFNRYAMLQSGDTKKFMNRLREMGYAGVIDVNDSRYSGYNSKQPVILFKQQDNISIDNFRKVPVSEIQKDQNTASKMLLTESMIMPMLVTTGLASSYYSLPKSKRKKIEKEIALMLA